MSAWHSCRDEDCSWLRQYCIQTEHQHGDWLEGTQEETLYSTEQACSPLADVCSLPSGALFLPLRCTTQLTCLLPLMFPPASLFCSLLQWKMQEIKSLQALTCSNRELALESKAADKSTTIFCYNCMWDLLQAASQGILHHFRWALQVQQETNMPSKNTKYLDGNSVLS